MGCHCSHAAGDNHLDHGVAGRVATYDPGEVSAELHCDDAVAMFGERNGALAVLVYRAQRLGRNVSRSGWRGIIGPLIPVKEFG